MDTYLNRALRAYRRSGERDQPSNASAVERVGGLNYAVLRNCRGTLAVYRIAGDRLRRLRRWPAPLNLQ